MSSSSDGNIYLAGHPLHIEFSFQLLVPYFDRMQVPARPGGGSVLCHRSVLIQRLGQVCYVVSSQDQDIQLGQFGVGWD